MSWNSSTEANPVFLTEGQKQGRRSELGSVENAIVYKVFKNLRSKTTLLQKADPRMFHGGSAHPGTATPRCWMLRLKEVLSEQLSHWSKVQ